MNWNDEISSEIARRRIRELTEEALKHNAFYLRLAARKREEWAALPWHVKMCRRIRARFYLVGSRIRSAWRVLFHGECD